MKSKPTHRIEFKKASRFVKASQKTVTRWNWYVYRVENDELICFSNQDHVRRVDAAVAADNFLAAAAQGRVELLYGE